MSSTRLSKHAVSCWTLAGVSQFSLGSAIALPTQSIVAFRDENVPTTRRNLTIDNLLTQLKHYSPSVKKGAPDRFCCCCHCWWGRSEALLGLTELLEAHSILIKQNLTQLINQLARMIADEVCPLYLCGLGEGSSQDPRMQGFASNSSQIYLGYSPKYPRLVILAAPPIFPIECTLHCRKTWSLMLRRLYFIRHLHKHTSFLKSE